MENKLKALIGILAIICVVGFSGCIGQDVPLLASIQGAASVGNATVLYAGENTGVPGMDTYTLNVTNTDGEVRLISRYSVIKNAVVTSRTDRGEFNYTVIRGTVTSVGSTTNDLIDYFIYGA